MGCLSWIIFGALAGWLASLITGTNDRNGCITNIVVGIVGAAIGGWIMGLFGFGGINGFNLYSLLVAILGAVALLVALGVLRKLAR